MDTSDDFITALFGGRDKDSDIPKREAENPTKTAQPLRQGSEAARRNRQRRRAATGVDLGRPTLGTPGLFNARV